MPTVLRLALWALAYAHTFPARHHLGEFFAAPSTNEAWKGFGALLAIAFYLLPIRFYVRAIGTIWRRSPKVFAFAGWLLALVHAIPAVDHLPKLMADPSFADGWRGFGAMSACCWFLLPLPLQARAITRLKQVAIATALSLTKGDSLKAR